MEISIFELVPLAGLTQYVPVVRPAGKPSFIQIVYPDDLSKKVLHQNYQSKQI